MEFLVKVVPANCHPGLPRDRCRIPQDRKLSKGIKERRSSEGVNKSHQDMAEAAPTHHIRRVPARPGACCFPQGAPGHMAARCHGP